MMPYHYNSHQRYARVAFTVVSWPSKFGEGAVRDLSHTDGSSMPRLTGVQVALLISSARWQVSSLPLEVSKPGSANGYVLQAPHVFDSVRIQIHI